MYAIRSYYDLQVDSMQTGDIFGALNNVMMNVAGDETLGTYLAKGYMKSILPGASRTLALDEGGAVDVILLLVPGGE